MKRWPTVLAVAGLVVVLGATNVTIAKRQQVVDSGQQILLDLRPVDPRSLIQGDYMVLRYAETLFPPPADRNDLPRRGAFIVKLDDRNIAQFARLDDGSPLADGEARLQYKQVSKRGDIRLGAESFFFQEGHGKYYNGARYGVLRVDASGKSVLVGLADDKGELLTAPDN